MLNESKTASIGRKNNPRRVQKSTPTLLGSLTRFLAFCILATSILSFVLLVSVEHEEKNRPFSVRMITPPGVKSSRNRKSKISTSTNISASNSRDKTSHGTIQGDSILSGTNHDFKEVEEEEEKLNQVLGDPTRNSNSSSNTIENDPSVGIPHIKERPSGIAWDHEPYNEADALGRSSRRNNQMENDEQKKYHAKMNKVKEDFLSHALPEWVTTYFQWHTAMRIKYPGNKLFTEPDAPKILIRICHTHLCGGLHDRLGQLPLDLYLASKSQRILMIQWFKPYALQEFLVPPSLSSLSTAKMISVTNEEYSIDWTLPQEWTQCKSLRICIQRFLNIPSLETNVGNGHVRGKNYTEMMDANYYNLTEGILTDEKIVQFEILGHGNNEDWLEQRLRLEGETDMIHNTPSFGKIFHSFFRLSPPIEKRYNDVISSLNLRAQEYVAVHLRVRHPSGYKRNAKMDGRYAGSADRNVPPFTKEFRTSAIQAAIRAFQCTALLKDAVRVRVEDGIAILPGHSHPQEERSVFLPIYMMSDTKELVKYFAFDLSNHTYLSAHKDWFSDPESTNSTAKRVASRFHIVSRDLHNDDENLHIDKATPPGKVEDYYSVFLDLFLGIHAKCVAFGIGNFAVFAAKISNTPCKILYQRAKLGTQGSSQSGDRSLSRDQICHKGKTW